MFDPRDDARDRYGREDGRERVYVGRNRDDLDPRDALMRDLDLPRGDERELVVDRDRVYELDGEDSRTLAAVGAFRVVPEHDLDVPHCPPRRFESETKVLGADGRFTFVLDAAKLTPGSYYLRFGRSKKFAGGQRFTVTSDTTKIDLGEVGECDV